MCIIQLMEINNVLRRATFVVVSILIFSLEKIVKPTIYITFTTNARFLKLKLAVIFKFVTPCNNSSRPNHNINVLFLRLATKSFQWSNKIRCYDGDYELLPCIITHSRLYQCSIKSFMWWRRSHAQSNNISSFYFT